MILTIHPSADEAEKPWYILELEGHGDAQDAQDMEESRQRIGLDQVFQGTKIKYRIAEVEQPVAIVTGNPQHPSSLSIRVPRESFEFLCMGGPLDFETPEANIRIRTDYIPMK